MGSKEIIIKGAREHNLKNVSINIPRNKLVVITGLSGSGKSSLAFDTIYAEGQRRYLESLSAYARQFMEQMKKPEVDSIEGLSPAISIEQKNVSRNPRSTVGTITEVYDFLRLLYARTGTPHCYVCHKPIQSQTLDQIREQIMGGVPSTKFAILAPIARGKKGEFQKELADIRGQGFVRAEIDGEEVSLSAPIKLKKTLKHDISIYIDRLVLKTGIESRLMEALEIANKLSNGLVEIRLFDDKPSSRFFSTQYGCADCGTSFPEVEPRSFSFNSIHGSCSSCNGLGSLPTFDPALVVPNGNLSIMQGAILPWAEKSKSWLEKVFQPLSEKYSFSLTDPFKNIPEAAQNLIFYGSGSEEIEFSAKGWGSTHAFKQKFEGVIPTLKERLEETGSSIEESELGQYITFRDCITCQGSRLKKESLSVLVGGKNIAEVSQLPVLETLSFVQQLSFPNHHLVIAEPILKEISARLNFLINVGLSYLSLSRSATTLSGGESQRIRLATQIGSNLVGVLYVLDEPSIGLHQKDNDKLIKTLEALRDQGNSVLVVEHDEETIQRADFVVDMGPGAGEHGGEILFSGSPKDLKNEKTGLTAQYFSRKMRIEIPHTRRSAYDGRYLKIIGAKQNNLKNINVDIPLGTLTCVTGVSGSGKSTLVIDTLLEALQLKFSGRTKAVHHLVGIEGMEFLDKVIYVDQSPIGRTPRSNPATYTGLFTDIRALFSGLPEAKVRGYTAGRFSFNVEGGRCSSCSGDGNLKISMNFLPDVYVQCEICRGARYNRETLDVHYRGKSIADVLSMTVEQAALFFERVPQIKAKLTTLLDVGLGYLQVGQNALTLSGGEAQRIKLAKELNKRATGRTIYILDEPTTGLHFEDVRKLLQILQTLVDHGNTVVVIEHNLDVIKQADHLIDLGVGGGKAGGEVLFQGVPEGLLKVENSFTGHYLKSVLNQ